MSYVYITTLLNCLGYTASNNVVVNDLEGRERDTFNELPAGNEKRFSGVNPEGSQNRQTVKYGPRNNCAGEDHQKCISQRGYAHTEITAQQT
jgi:hypothetical protein